MIQGLSYRHGIFFFRVGEGIAHATCKDGVVKTRFFPWGWAGIRFLASRVLFTLPWYFWALAALILLLRLPLYGLVLLGLGYHFLFPKTLRQFHGAEHKVFSYQGSVELCNLRDIADADIVNRGCSTNSVTLFFLVFLPLAPFLGGWWALAAAGLAVRLIPRYARPLEERVFFPISAWLQRRVTTATPDDEHLRTAILAYKSLAAGRAVDES
jgi:uncharacterized protein YqhQ